MRVGIAAIMVLGLAGCLSPGEDAFIKAVKKETDQILLDYSTARFRDVRLASSDRTLCGEVNSKNRLGAYVGWQRFSAAESPGGGPPIVAIGDASSYAHIKCDVLQGQLSLAKRDLSERMTYGR